MTIRRKRKAEDHLKIGLDMGQDWSTADLAEVQKYIIEEFKRRTPEQLATKVYAIKCRIEACLEGSDIRARKKQK